MKRPAVAELPEMAGLVPRAVLRELRERLIVRLLRRGVAFVLVGSGRAEDRREDEAYIAGASYRGLTRLRWMR